LIVIAGGGSTCAGWLSDNRVMAFDGLVANPGRLRILTALARGETEGGRLEFTHLRSVTRLTDGNLATHARRLSGAGLVRVDKSFRGGKPVTTFVLTREGRAALEEHVREVLGALAAREPSGRVEGDEEPAEEAWID
jgi:DNA-binding transcriptional ArsR family regulator